MDDNKKVFELAQQLVEAGDQSHKAARSIIMQLLRDLIQKHGKDGVLTLKEEITLIHEFDVLQQNTEGFNIVKQISTAKFGFLLIGITSLGVRLSDLAYSSTSLLKLIEVLEEQGFTL